MEGDVGFKLALLSCRELPEWEQDDRYFHEVLSKEGVDWQVLPWDIDVDWSQFDVALIRTTWDYVDRISSFSQRLSHIATQTQLLNSIEVVQWNLHKTYLQDLALEGVPIAPTHWLNADGSKTLREIMETEGWQKGFLKPVVGASASDTFRFSWNEIDQAQQWMDGILSDGKSMMLQPYLETVEREGEYSAIFFGGRLSHCVQKIPVQGDYRVQDDYGASDGPVSIETLSQLTEVAKQVMVRLQHRFADILVARLDFLRLENGNFVVNEVEMVEPSLFFRHSPTVAPRMLLEELSKRVGR